MKDLAQSRQALHDKTSKIEELRTTHYRAAAALNQKHNDKLSKLKSELEAVIADRDKSIALSSDNKALTDLAAQYKQQGDANGVADVWFSRSLQSFPFIFHFLYSLYFFIYILCTLFTIKAINFNIDRLGNQYSPCPL